MYFNLYTYNFSLVWPVLIILISFERIPSVAPYKFYLGPIMKSEDTEHKCWTVGGTRTRIELIFRKLSDSFICLLCSKVSEVLNSKKVKN